MCTARCCAGSDVHLINSDGGYADFTAYAVGKPQICGHEVIGCVTAMGPAVADLKVGQRVGIGWQNGACHECEWCKRGDEQLCSAVKATCCEGQMGGFADYIRIADSKFAFAIPDECDSATTAPLLCGGQTVWTPLVQQTKQSDKVGVLGLGGLGHMAIKFASALGRTVTALSSTTSKKEEALALGAHTFVAHGDDAAMAEAASSLDFILVTLATQVRRFTASSSSRPAGVRPPYLSLLRLLPRCQRPSSTPLPPPPALGAGVRRLHQVLCPAAPARHHVLRRHVPAHHGGCVHDGLHDAQHHDLEHGRAQGDRPDARVLRQAPHRCLRRHPADG